MDSVEPHERFSALVDALADHTVPPTAAAADQALLMSKASSSQQGARRV